MFAQSRRSAAQRTIGTAEPHRRPYHSDAAFSGMIGSREHVYGGEMLVFRQFGEPVDRARRNVGRFELLEPERGRSIAYAFGDQCIKLGDMLAAGLRIRETRIVAKLGSTGYAEEILPVTIRVGEDANV